MKADPSGTGSEQAFARMGWKSAKEAKALGMKPCSECHFFEMATVKNGGGEFTIKPRCIHTMTIGNGVGQATKENASCKKWEVRHVR